MADYNKAGKIWIAEDGPYFLSGNVPLSEAVMVHKGRGKQLFEGRKLPQAEEVHLCRCGGSQDAPFCDGTHKSIGFDGTETAERSGFSERAERNEGPDMVLLDDRKMCVHAGFCRNDKASTWDLAAASDDPENRSEAIRTTNECPSGRLVAQEKSGDSLEVPSEPSVTIVQDPVKGTSAGLFVRGLIPLSSQDGTPYEDRNRYTLCRCGQSKNKPFCDESHLAAQFQDSCPRAERLTRHNLKEIEQVYREENTHWVGTAFKVANYFPEGGHFDLKRFSPFVLMDYNYPIEFKPGLSQKTSGPHPHRGLETVSIVFEGALEHRDNAGNSGVVKAGEVQWMSTGSGILHKESHSPEFTRSGGTLKALQLWLNIPSARKSDPPSYQLITDKDMGKVTLPGGAGKVRIISGIYNGVPGPARTYRRLNIFVADLKPQGRLLLNEPKVFNTGILMIDGSARVNGEREAAAGDFVLFKNEYGDIIVEAGEAPVRLVVLSGEPIGEPVVAQGTFVMSSQEEIDQANDDYRAGVFGSTDF